MKTQLIKLQDKFILVNNEEIIKSNKLIAEFMKPASYDKRRKDYPFPFPVIEIVPAEKIMGYGSVPEGEIKHFSGQPDMMKYHSSWDWLMPVAEKCVCQITDADEETQLFANMHDGLWEFNKEKTWLAVVEFINWFNKSKKEEND